MRSFVLRKGVSAPCKEEDRKERQTRRNKDKGLFGIAINISSRNQITNQESADYDIKLDGPQKKDSSQTFIRTV